MKPPFILIDGSSYFYRAFHALPPLANSRGEPTGAVYGVINMIRRLIKDYQPEYMAVVFDTKGKTFRDELYPEYKANRSAMPDDLTIQFEPLIEVIEAMGLPLLMVEGVEADDVIGTLAIRATEQGMKTVISTGDKDMAQLVDKHVTLINTMSNTVLDEAGVKGKFGIKPNQIIDYLTLMGDTSDNIPGVVGVGPKTAVKWLEQYHSLDKIIAHADEIKGKVGENLRAALPQIPLSRELVTIKKDVKLSSEPTDLKPTEPNRELLIELFKQLEFKGWLEELLKGSVKEKKEKLPNQYETILNQKQFDTWLTKLKKSKLFAIDTETTDLNSLTAELVGISFSVKADEAAYVPLAHDYDGAPKQLDRNEVLNAIKPLLEDPELKKIGQNIKYDMEVFANYGINVQGVAFDTMLESYVLNSTAGRHDMDSLALKYLGKSTIHFEQIAGKGSKQLTFNQIKLEEASPYAAEDADITLQLHETLWPKIQHEKGLRHVFESIEMPLVPVLSHIERNGVLIDIELLNAQSQELEIRIKELEEKAYKIAGEVFNLSSPKQLQTILFEKLKIPVMQKTPTGQPSTAEAVLQELAYDYPLPKVIVDYRSLTKLKSTYTDALPKQVNPKTGRVHTSYNQAVASTGRLSSTDPNLQNIPVRTEEGRRIRKAFIAPQGYQIVSADYSQIELRIMAHLSQDKGLLKAFANGWDVHKATAAEVFGVPLEKVTQDQRRKSKAINFGLIYGMSAFGLAKQIDTTREAAQEYMDLYFHRYPGVKTYMEDTRKKAHKLGYVETIFGRRLYLPEINSQNFQRQRAAERAAINAPMQGTAADIIKLAMIKVDDWLRNTKIDAKMIMQVHDELVFEVAKSDVEQLVAELQDAMCNVVDLHVPIHIEVGVGSNWDDAH
ncbi:MAG: DNA polymerase I [Proteobacteria bacterium]|nr:DNA polymerase I [Pseudomonadota bacterium]